MPRPSPSTPKAEKNMSSRLLTMKFMQRAAASAAAQESSQPESASNSQASTPKKRRISTEPAESSSPTRPSDMEAISAALAEEEEKRRDAVARQAAEAGETEWFLDFDGADSAQYAQPPVVLADYSLDADDDDIAYGGRQAYGNYKKKNKPTVVRSCQPIIRKLIVYRQQTLLKVIKMQARLGQRRNRLNRRACGK
ncbi:hypothetical protein BJY00DRAFT_233664 [Aspergillus carlsbadensis]|nr:hypothetical protein BJY00DRAFT_233664 [Aspergillus carlsbadensis]